MIRSTSQALCPALLAAMLCGGACSAHAATLNVTATANMASGLPDTQTYTTAVAADLFATHTVSTSIVSFGSSASGWAEGGAGVIRMDALVHVVNAANFGYQPQGNFIQSGGQNNSVGLTEQLIVNSATLPAGTPVDLLFTLSFAQTVTLSQAASMYLGGGYYAAFAANPQYGVAVNLVANGVDDVNATGSSVVMHTLVGGYINVTESMSGGVGATYFDSTERSGEADASHSAHFYVDALTAGVSIGSESGHDYSTASSVPEPGAAALFMSGLACLGGLVRRRRRGT